MGNKTSPGARRNSGHAGTNIPNASEERDYRGASEFPRILFQCISGAQGFRRVASSIRFKKGERSHFHTIFTCSPYGGFPNFGHLDPIGPQASYLLFRAQGSNFCPTSLGLNAPGPPGFDRYGQHNSSFLYQQTRRNPFPILVTSSCGSLYVPYKLRT